MATKTVRNGNGNQINTAIAVLLQTQAQFVSELAETRKEFADMKKDLDLIKALLIRHEDTLQKLPDAIKDKIGYKQ